MKIAYFGTPDFAVPTLEALVESRHEVVLVVSKPDKPVGRKKVMTSPPVIETARRLGLAVAQPKGLKNGKFDQPLVDSGAEIAVVVAYGKLIPAEVLELPARGFVNLHPSMLPRHRGPSPIQWALVCGDRSTGVTTMRLDEGMDTGPLLLQERLPIEPEDTAETLSSRMAELGARLVVRTVDALEDGTVEARPQPEDGVNVTPMLRRNFAKVDWTMPARQLVNRLRGFTPWPGLYTTFRGGRLKIFGLEEIKPPPAGREEPGTVVDAGPSGIAIRCGRGSAALITEVQREGRRRMPVDAFLIGERVSRGECVG
ncbi:MAG: methionyl-tRNA formyltransferase [Thermoanaerobaculales bacterium]|jgi:methionyl-tRNA formyltransferase|nr:methionyl-tRNA formyltransferase [Thermoanaerobaculales bacterium]